MKNHVKLILVLVCVTTLVESVFTLFRVEKQREHYTEELNIRASILAESLQESVRDLLLSVHPFKLNNQFYQIGIKDKFSRIIVYDSLEIPIETTGNEIMPLSDSVTQIRESINKCETIFGFAPIGGKKMFFYSFPIIQNNKALGALLLVHDDSYFESEIIKHMGKYFSASGCSNACNYFNNYYIFPFNNIRSFNSSSSLDEKY